MFNTIQTKVNPVLDLYEALVSDLTERVRCNIKDDFVAWSKSVAALEDEIPDLISSKDVCKLLGLGRTTLYNYTKSGRLHSHRLGRKVYYSKKQLLQDVTLIKRYERNNLSNNLKNTL